MEKGLGHSPLRAVSHVRACFARVFDVVILLAVLRFILMSLQLWEAKLAEENAFCMSDILVNREYDRESLYLFVDYGGLTCSGTAGHLCPLACGTLHADGSDVLVHVRHLWMSVAMCTFHSSHDFPMGAMMQLRLSGMWTDADA